MPAPLLRRVMAAFPHCRLSQGCGMTETSPTIAILEPDNHVLDGPHAGRAQSVGRAAYAVEVHIVDETDRELPRGSVGEIVTRGSHAMLGYWRQPELTAQALAAARRQQVDRPHDRQKPEQERGRAVEHGRRNTERCGAPQGAKAKTAAEMETEAEVVAQESKARRGRRPATAWCSGRWALGAAPAIRPRACRTPRPW